MAEAAAIGVATEPGVDVRLVEALTAKPDGVLAARRSTAAIIRFLGRSTDGPMAS